MNQQSIDVLWQIVAEETKEKKFYVSHTEAVQAIVGAMVNAYENASNELDEKYKA